MNVLIQIADIDDAEAIAGVHRTGVLAAYQSQIPNHLLALPAASGTRHWKEWLKRSRAITCVARVDETVTGFCTLHPAYDEATPGLTGEIPALYVLPSYWRRGIGRQLCVHILAEARTCGFTEVVLWVLESNERARHFYNSLGFRADSHKRVFLERADAPLHELRYRKNT